MKKHFSICFVLTVLTLLIILNGCTTTREVRCPDWSYKPFWNKNLRNEFIFHKRTFMVSTHPGVIFGINKNKKDKKINVKDSVSHSLSAVNPLVTDENLPVPDLISSVNNTDMHVLRENTVNIGQTPKQTFNNKYHFTDFVSFKKFNRKISNDLQNGNYSGQNDVSHGIRYGLMSFIIAVLGFPASFLIFPGILAIVWGIQGMRNSGDFILALLGIILGISELILGVFLILLILMQGELMYSLSWS